jgi:hypothetical protein
MDWDYFFVEAVALLISVLIANLFIWLVSPHLPSWFPQTCDAICPRCDENELSPGVERCYRCQCEMNEEYVRYLEMEAGREPYSPFPKG